MTTIAKRIDIPKFTDNLKSISIGNSMLWQANGVQLMCNCDNLMMENGRRICSVKMVANGFCVCSVDVMFRRRHQMAECIERAILTGHFEPRCGTYRIL